MQSGGETTTLDLKDDEDAYYFDSYRSHEADIEEETMQSGGETTPLDFKDDEGAYYYDSYRSHEACGSSARLWCDMEDENEDGTSPADMEDDVYTAVRVPLRRWRSATGRQGSCLRRVPWAAAPRGVRQLAGAGHGADDSLHATREDSAHSYRLPEDREAAIQLGT